MTRVLLVCMLDSIHSARWLSQFSGANIEFRLIASRRHRSIHPEMQRLLKDYSDNFKIERLLPFSWKLEPYCDFIAFEILGKYLPTMSRHRFLRTKIGFLQPDFIHLLEIQNAGYLYLDSNLGKSSKFHVILTNWGSDIYYFKNFVDHQEKISRLLTQIDSYSAECRRDYYLASELGFKGKNLPLIPNSGGFSSLDLNRKLFDPLLRKKIYLKGYGGRFGLIIEAIKAIERILEDYPEYSLVITSVTRDVKADVQKLLDKFPGRISFYLIENQQPHEQIMKILSESAIYVGASQSDGISTTFLEALVAGCYAIQTDTSCANEWLERGFIASVVETTSESIYSELERVINDDLLRIQAFDTNTVKAREHLNQHTIAQIAQDFYKV